jgi:hypothetical protein
MRHSKHSAGRNAETKMKKDNAKRSILEHNELQQDREIHYDEYRGKVSFSGFMHILLGRSRASECGKGVAQARTSFAHQKSPKTSATD